MSEKLEFSVLAKRDSCETIEGGTRNEAEGMVPRSKRKVHQLNQWINKSRILTNGA